MEIPLYKSNTIPIYEQREVKKQDCKQGESAREKERQYTYSLGKRERNGGRGNQ